MIQTVWITIEMRNTDDSFLEKICQEDNKQK
jgi:hypothetical protein